MALYNEEDTAQTIALRFAAIGWSATTAATVRDLWAHTDNGTHVGSFPPVVVEPHSTVLLRLRKK